MFQNQDTRVPRPAWYRRAFGKRVGTVMCIVWYTVAHSCRQFRKKQGFPSVLVRYSFGIGLVVFGAGLPQA